MVFLCSLRDTKIAMANAGKYESPRLGLCANYLLYRRFLFRHASPYYLQGLADSRFYSWKKAPIATDTAKRATYGLTLAPNIGNVPELELTETPLTALPEMGGSGEAVPFGMGIGMPPLGIGIPPML